MLCLHKYILFNICYFVRMKFLLVVVIFPHFFVYESFITLLIVNERLKGLIRRLLTKWMKSRCWKIGKNFLFTLNPNDPKTFYWINKITFFQLLWSKKYDYFITFLYLLFFFQMNDKKNFNSTFWNWVRNAHHGMSIFSIFDR